FIAITSPARIDILEGGVVDLFGTLEGGGTFEANSGGVFSSFGTIDVTGGNDGPAGHVDIESQDLAVIAGTVTVAGRSNAETEGLLLVTACFTEMRVGGLFDNRVEGGESRLVGRESVTLRLNAELRATNSGLNHLVYGEASQRPVIFGIVSPKAVETLDETLEPCPRCGNNEIEQGESCDDGNVDAGDGCDADCVDEGCIADTPGYPAVPLCDDSDACTLDSCDSAASECVFVPSCNDGVDCSTDACEEGECVSTPNDAACNDADVCTDDICSLLTGCASIENTSVCDDGLFCTVLDSCTDGVCSGQPRDCSDGIDCTQDSCDEARNTCEALATDSLCADDLFCNGDETCNESSGCEAGTPPECSGLDDQCLRGICDEGPDFCSTEASNEGAGCDDGLFCTVDDACTGGVCAGQARDCSDGIECTVDACDELLGACAAPLSDDTACADDLFCNGVETCNASSGCEAGEVSDCSAFDDQCLVGTCDEALDSCAGEPVNDATVCDDGNVCTENDSCLDGLCVGSVIDDCATCGNDVVEGGETCDDGDVVFIGGDACDETCQSVSCGYPLTLRGDRPRASDALHILRTSVEQRTCALSVCDVSGNGSIQASDALRVLRAAVGQVVELDCTQAL
ncbi:MAG: cysteine-rich repeat protein, partial [Hyphomicrobiaceae bacterium]